MRKKIGKRIGPVPITLAVFALAAFLSVGLLLTANGGVTQAQGLPTGSQEPAPDGDDCEFVLASEGANPDAVADAMRVEGGGCIASGDSVDVEFLNYNESTPEAVVVYVTGGGDYSNVQAMGIQPGASQTTALGARGVSEHSLTVDERTDGLFSTVEPGSETITVSRSMAKDGEVYLFVYKPTQADFATTSAGLPLYILSKAQTAWPDTFKDGVYNSVDLTATNSAYDAFETAAESGTSGLPDGTSVQSFPVTVTIDGATVSVAATNGRYDDEQAVLAEVRAEINRVKGLTGYGTDTVRNSDDVVTTQGTENVEVAVATAEAAIAIAEAAIEAIEDSDPRHFFNESTASIAVKVVFRNTASAAKLVGGAYNPDHENGTKGSTLFLGRAGGGHVDEDEAPDDLTGTAEKANVTVRVRDSQGVYLKGFVDLSIDTSAEGAADAVFTASARSSYYVELGAGTMPDGTATAEIKGLPKNDPLRIPVTASFNNGELELMANIVRKGDAVMVVADAYACEPDSDDKEAGVCASEIAAFGTSNTSDDPDEVVALGPGDSFVINGKATDAVGNAVGSKGQLTWKITPGADNEDDAEDSLDDANGSGLEAITVTGDTDSVPGTYSLTVTSPDGEASTIIMITVSDVASMIEVTCDPVMVPTDTGQTDCVVMVTDANGNIPSNLGKSDDDDTIQVTVRSRDAQIIGVDDKNRTDIDKEGMATFSILLREDAVEGSSITVNVSTSEIGDATLRESVTVTYGDAPSEPEMPTELTAPSGVVVSSLANTQSVSVSWDTTSIQNAQQIKVVLFNSDVTGIAKPLITINPANDPGSATFNDVPDGMYIVVVASFRTGERHKLSDLEEVTVE